MKREETSSQKEDTPSDVFSVSFPGIPQMLFTPSEINWPGKMQLNTFQPFFLFFFEGFILDHIVLQLTRQSSKCRFHFLVCLEPGLV